MAHTPLCYLIVIMVMARLCQTYNIGSWPQKKKLNIENAAVDTLEIESEKQIEITPVETVTAKYQTIPLKDLRDPIVNMALSIFHSLEDFCNDHYEHSPEFLGGKYSEEKLKDKRTNDTVNTNLISEKHFVNHNNKEIHSINNEHIQLKHQIPIKYTIVEDYKNVQGYINVNIQKQNNDNVIEMENRTKIDKNNISEKPIVKLRPFNFNFSFPSIPEKLPNNENQSINFSEETTDRKFSTNDVDDERYIYRYILKEAPLNKRKKHQIVLGF
jgi:hypothetical protein